MKSTASVLAGAALTIARALPGGSGIVQWGPCPDGEFENPLSLNIECGTLRVPLDYTLPEAQPNATQLYDLELVRVRAPYQPANGTIQFNFGGPGLPARSELVDDAIIYQAMTGGTYDLVAFDPRGLTEELPFYCTQNEYFQGQMMSETRSGDESNTTLSRLWTRGAVDVNICVQQGNGNKTGQYIGTGFMARDILKVAEALDEDGLIRYWGFSYGTLLGSTLAAMFPEKIDRMVIDGVQNPHDYYNDQADYEEWHDTDKAFSAFFKTCMEAGPELCVLAGLNKTATELESDAWNFLDSLIDAPIVAGVMVLDVNTARSLIREGFKTTARWSDTAKALAGLIYGKKEEQPLIAQALLGAPQGGNVSVAAQAASIDPFYGIHCGDRVVRLEKFEDVLPVFQRLTNTSRLWGAGAVVNTMRCSRWPWKAKGGYKGDFKVKTRRPVLVTNPTIDAHTPVKSARNVSSGLEDSGLLLVDGIGHGAISVPSTCYFGHIMNYWANATLPPNGTVCDADAKPWENYTWIDALKKIEGGNLTSSKTKRKASRRSFRLI